MSLRWRLTIWYALASLVTLAALFFAVRRLTGSILLSDLDSDLSNEATSVAGDLGGIPVSNSEALATLVREPREITLGPGRVAIALLDPQGNVLASSRNAPAAIEHLDAGDLSTVNGGGTISRSVTPKGSHKVRLYASSATAGGGDKVIVVTEASTSTIDAAVDRMETVLIGVVSVGALLSVVIGYLIARGGLLRLRQVVDVAAETEASALLDRRISARNEPAEVQKLADTFDAMLERLQGAFDQQRAFVADVSHELRTPLTALRGNLDVLLMDPSLDPEVRSYLERMAAETGRLSRLVANLLSLASAEAGRQPDRRPVELDVLLLEVYQEQRALRPEVRLRLGHEDQVSVLGDRDLLRQLLTNLVENAVKYSRAGGQVSCSLYRDDSQATIEVSDSGPGIAPEDLPHIFERFYRGRDAARTGGTGLGLAIAQWVATVHGGRIDVESEPGTGTTFRVALPLAPTPQVRVDDKTLTKS